MLKIKSGMTIERFDNVRDIWSSSASVDCDERTRFDEGVCLSEAGFSEFAKHTEGIVKSIRAHVRSIMQAKMFSRPFAYQK